MPLFFFTVWSLGRSWEYFSRFGRKSGPSVWHCIAFKKSHGVGGYVSLYRWISYWSIWYWVFLYFFIAIAIIIIIITIIITIFASGYTDFDCDWILSIVANEFAVLMIWTVLVQYRFICRCVLLYIVVLFLPFPSQVSLSFSLVYALVLNLGGKGIYSMLISLPSWLQVFSERIPRLPPPNLSRMQKKNLKKTQKKTLEVLSYAIAM